MIIKFEFENWMSFRERATFSMIATKERQHGDRLPSLKKYGTKVLPVSALYGGNASGKTNFFRALSFVRTIVLEGTRPNMAIKTEPFRLDTEFASEPSCFLLEFLVDDTIYAFSFSVTKDSVVEEKLVKIFSTKEQVLYERSGNRISLHSSLKNNYLKILAEKTPKNQLFLTHTMNVGAEQFSTVFNWFRHSLVLVAPASRFKPYDKFFREDDPLYQSMNTMLTQLDTGICQIGELEIPENQIQFPGNAFEGLSEGEILHLDGAREQLIVSLKNGKPVIKKLVTYHANTDGGNEVFEISEESDGSKRLIDLIPAFLDISAPGSDCVYIIDEVDRSLHTILIRKLIEYYLGSCSAKNRSQLVLTTHNVLLMDQKIFRRDELWVTERDQSGASKLFSISDYNARNDKDIRKSYLQGRFGGIPRIILSEELNNAEPNGQDE